MILSSKTHYHKEAMLPERLHFLSLGILFSMQRDFVALQSSL